MPREPIEHPRAVRAPLSAARGRSLDPLRLTVVMRTLPEHGPPNESPRKTRLAAQLLRFATSLRAEIPSNLQVPRMVERCTVPPARYLRPMADAPHQSPPTDQ